MRRFDALRLQGGLVEDAHDAEHTPPPLGPPGDVRDADAAMLPAGIDL